MYLPCPTVRCLIEPYWLSPKEPQWEVSIITLEKEVSPSSIWREVLILCGISEPDTLVAGKNRVSSMSECFETMPRENK